MNFGLVVSGYPPDVDGIGDYACLLAQAMSRSSEASAPVTVFTRKGEVRTFADVDVVPFFDTANAASFSELRSLLHDAQSLDWLLLQYNPFSWGVRGFCPAVPRTLQAISKLPSAPKLAVMFHEIFTGDAGWKNRLMRMWQKRFTKQVASIAALRMTSCQIYADWLCSQGFPAHPLPVGSNLPNVASGTKAANSGVLLVGSFGTPHPSRRVDLMVAALTKLRAAGLDARFTFIGSGGEKARDVFEGNRVPFRATGAVSSELAALELRKLDMFLAPFADGLSGRRASAIAALQAAVPVVSTAGPATDPFLTQQNGISLVLARTDEEYIERVWMLANDAGLRNRLGIEGGKFYQRVLDWPIIALQLARLLQEDDSC